MNLKQLFLENDGSSSAVIAVLQQAKWVMRQLDTMSALGDMDALASYLKQNKIHHVTTANTMMYVDINRFGSNPEFVEPLRQIYFPEIDVPKQSMEGEFHTDDEFDSEYMLLGIEFIISGASGEITTECIASLADTNQDIDLAPPIRQWMYEKYIKAVEELSAKLSQS